ISNGALLGLLIDPYQRQVHIYRPGVEPEVLDDPETMSGEPEQPGFVFEARRRIFDKGGSLTKKARNGRRQSGRGGAW
ncbi:MAG: Uma2 family endonuclease, partial [Dehalococcoidia bacterium]|nr:Uma2 family endonuclease [Dehalococcoidia bacterium]